MVPYGTLWHLMVPYGTLLYLMVLYGTLWYPMVPYGTLWYHKVTLWYLMVPYEGTIRYNVKTKKYHNSTQNCQFSMIFGPKWPKFHGDSFPKVKRSKFLYICWVLMFFLIFRYKNELFFSKVKNPKNFWRPNSVSPHPGRGTLVNHMVPYGTIWYRYHIVPYGTIW